MQAYIAKRLLQAAVVVLLVTFAVFSLELLLPGDPVVALISQSNGQGALSPQQIAIARHDLGLDQPIPVQYWRWLSRVAHGNLGNSVKTNRPVLTEIGDRLPVTLQLSIAAFIVALVISIPAGIAAAVWHGSPLDRLITGIAISAVAIPDFWLGIMFILLFSVKLNWLPPSGYVSIFDDPLKALQLLVMPAIILGWAGAGGLARQTRSAMLDVLGQDYIRTARAKGLASSRVIWLHALKNALPPVVTLIGLGAGFILAGTVIAETIFAIPGIGRLAVDSINTKDFPVVQGYVLIIALCVVLAALITDISYVFLDPRIRFR
jgi:peptide/nickel transport system permease protein